MRVSEDALFLGERLVRLSVLSVFVRVMSE